MWSLGLKRLIVSGLKYQILSLFHSIALSVKGDIHLIEILETKYAKLKFNNG